MRFSFSRTLLLSFLAVSLLGCTTREGMEKKRHRAGLHMQMGKSLMANGKLPEALTEFTIAEQLLPKNAEIQNQIGIVYQLRERPKEAEQRFKEALRLQPRYTEVRSNLARLYIDTARYPEAMKEINLIENDLTYPAPDKALVLKGMVYFKQRQYDKAETVLTKAYQLQRDGCLGAYFLGRTHYEQKKMPLAAQVLDQAVSNCKGAKFEEPLFYSSMAYYGLGEKLQAKARAEELLNDHPKSPLVDKAKALLKILDEQ
jgi:type IV pilus assembly protein PilF